MAVVKRCKEVNLVFCLQLRNDDDSYAKALAAFYLSIKERSELNVCINIIHDETVSEDIKTMLMATVRTEDRIRWIDADQCNSAYSLGKDLDCSFSSAMIWRAWIPEYLTGLDECLSLDCDLLMLMNIKMIVNIDISQHYLSAPLRKTPWTEEYHKLIRTPPDKYFRNGVCKMNLKKMRENSEYMTNKMSFLRECPDKEGRYQPLVLWEQSLFNRYFSDGLVPMHIDLIAIDRLDSHPRKVEWEQSLRSGSDIVLDVKGWLNKTKYSEYFWRLLLDTPWREEAVKNLGSLRWDI